MASTSPNPVLKRRLMNGEIPEWLKRHPRRSYIEAACLSYPLWVDRQDRLLLRQLAYRAASLSEMTGVPHVLDHVVPLNHPRVCGLTVLWNLEIVPYTHNARKSNRCDLNNDQLELFI